MLFELIITHLEVWYQPINDVLQSNVSNYAFQRFAAQVNFAGRAFGSLLVLAKEGVNTAFAVGTHTLVYCVSVSVDSFTKEASQVLEHVGLSGT